LWPGEVFQPCGTPERKADPAPRLAAYLGSRPHWRARRDRRPL